MCDFKLVDSKNMFTNMRMVLLGLSCFVISAFQSVNADYASHVGMKNTTGVVEVVSSLKIVLDKQSLTGFVEVPICNYDCVDTKLTITPETNAYIDGILVPLIKAKSRFGREVSLVYDIPTNRVTKISW